MDFGQGAVGVEAGRLFAEYGADVMKIESRSHYDFIRVITGIEMGPSFASSSRSKRGLGVNARTPEGRDLLRELAKVSDVVIENGSTGVMEELGIGYADLVGRQPRHRHGRQPAHGLPRRVGVVAGLRPEHPGPGWPVLPLELRERGGARRHRLDLPRPLRRSPLAPSARWPP